MSTGGILVMLLAAGAMLGGWLAAALTSRRLQAHHDASSRPSTDGAAGDLASEDVTAKGRAHPLVHVDFVRAGQRPQSAAEKGLTTST